MQDFPSAATRGCGMMWRLLLTGAWLSNFIVGLVFYAFKFCLVNLIEHLIIKKECDLPSSLALFF